jgi:DMSO reductase anchor subunit
MIYRIPARPAWNRKSTTRRFFGSAYAGFLLIATILTATGGTQGALVLLSVTLLTGMAQVLVIFEEVMFYRHLRSDDPLFYQLDRTRTLLQERFGRIKKARLYTLVAFGVILPLFGILFVASGLHTFASVTLFVATAGAFASEIAGRYLFYRTVVPLGLAGNFFAGRQRH